MRFRFSLAVWGQWHIDQFITNALPSLKAPGNLDSIDYVIAAYTRSKDYAQMKSALEGVKAELSAPIPDDTGDWQEIANCTIQSYAAQDIRTAVTANEVWGLLAPDMVWSEGTFALYSNLVDAGNKAIFRPLLRVDADKTGKIEDFSKRNLARLALECEHDIGKIYRADAEHFTTHPEAIIWPAPDGRLHQTISADVVLCVAQKMDISSQFLSAAPFGDMAVITDSDESVALAMCPADKFYGWQHGSGRLTPTLVRNFVVSFPSPAIRSIAERPYRLHCEDTESSRWTEVEQKANAFIAEVFK